MRDECEDGRERLSKIARSEAHLLRDCYILFQYESKSAELKARMSEFEDAISEYEQQLTD